MSIADKYVEKVFSKPVKEYVDEAIRIARLEATKEALQHVIDNYNIGEREVKDIKLGIHRRKDHLEILKQQHEL